MADRIDSNVVGLYVAEEETLGVLPTTPIWKEREPNDFGDFGAELSNVARDPINASRQRKKGKLVDLDASGGFTEDVKVSTLPEDAQGFLFADAHEKFSTIPLNGTAIPLTAVTTSQYQAASGLDSFLEGHLIKGSNFADAANDGLALVTTVAAGAITVDKTLVADASPAATAKIEAVGFEFPTGDLDITASATSIVLSTSVTDFTTLGLIVGEWIYLGGDVASDKFVNNTPGFARIASISANALSLDETTWTPVTETGTGLTVRMFFGVAVRNEKNTALIKRRTYQLERQLGQDDNGVQSEYLIKSVANEMKISIPVAEKMTVDFGYVAGDVESRTGLQGIKSGTRVSATIEDCFNTSSDIVRSRLAVVDPTELNNSALFGYINSLDITINNNAKPNKAVGVLGAFDISVGNFDVSGSIDAYFSTVEALTAIRNNADVELNIIAAMDNTGMVMDMPLLALGNGRPNVTKDESIMIPLDQNAAECANGYTLMICAFNYLPDIAMP